MKRYHLLATTIALSVSAFLFSSVLFAQNNAAAQFKSQFCQLNTAAQSNPVISNSVFKQLVKANTTPESRYRTVRV